MTFNSPSPAHRPVTSTRSRSPPAPGRPAPPPGTTDEAVDFDTIKAENFGTADDAEPRPNRSKRLNAKRLAFRYVLFAHNLVGNPSGGSNSSGCAEVGGDDAVVTLGSFATTTVDGVSHNRGPTDQQAGTFMHEFGHLLGLEHGGTTPSTASLTIGAS